MVDYSVFKNKVEKDFPDYMGKDFSYDFVKILKINKEHDSIIVKDNTADENQISPTVYIDDMYRDYCTYQDYNMVMMKYADTVKKGFEEASKINIAGLMSAGKVKENIIFRLINTEQNEKLLEDLPHRAINDLSVIYSLVVKMDSPVFANTLIKNDFAEKIGLTEEELYELAYENTKRMFPPTLKNMGEVLRELSPVKGKSEPENNFAYDSISDLSMWVLSNEQGINGAVNMLYEEELYKISEKLKENLYVLPSSIHEVIAVPESMGNPYILSDMVSEVNRGVVTPEEILSYEVYHYDRGMRKLTCATDEKDKVISEGKIKENANYFSNRTK